MQYKWILTGNFFKVWSGTLFSQLSAVLFFYSLIWWALQGNESIVSGTIIIAIGATVTLIVSPVSGWFADRYHRGRLLAIVDASLCVLFLLLIGSHYLTFIHSVSVVLFCRILISIGLGSADAAARSLIQENVPEDKLNQAIGFSESLNQAVHLAAPAITGILVYHFGVIGIWYLCAGLTGLAAILEVLIKDTVRLSKNMTLNSQSLLKGFKQVYNNLSMRYLLYGTVIQQLLFSGFAIYIAVWSTLSLQNNEWLSGILQAVWATGSLIGALSIVFFLRIKNIRQISIIITLIIGILIAPLGFITNTYSGLAILCGAGIFSGILNVYLETHLQRLTTKEFRGRELSAFFAINNSLVPFGYVLAGLISDAVPVHYLFLIIIIPIPMVAIFINKSFHNAKRLNKEKVGSDGNTELGTGAKD